MHEQKTDCLISRLDTVLFVQLKAGVRKGLNAGMAKLRLYQITAAICTAFSY
jgi:hypothetical protein